MKNKNSFTLLEMIFAIVVIGILASFAIPKFFNTTTDAKVSSLQRDINTVITSIQSYYLVNMKIEKISDSINLNNKLWTINDKNIIYKENEKECVKIEILSQNLKEKINLVVDGTTGNICKKLNENGVVSVAYNLN